ncbi:MAG: hypothetical protein COT91_01180 [Candidatus Doudnabacteria bacterium CG10_big_fil_rev_8_21_14_0_10_41_10]|uniref:Phenylacetate--CoA ligase n=1 Tax=Candidatus Doudnabacteria bacterium CG10_big_fil_rev_8_21_14_0_10_41_10 TaxID=1974551 RepID=A0A2H0VEG6_9BACT|nr:MAG: hypothetical protein COT91_01180 [Candidatus Doudnabacteria bacterium CG10_big_fil_rev_8_21_14_0_10_41_10]
MLSETFPKDLQNPVNLIAQLQKQPEKYWQERGFLMAKDLFWQKTQRVPAYKKFLAGRNINLKLPDTVSDFDKIPPVDKDNYLRKYKRSDLCWDGNFSNQHWVISTTSGSTGKPYYFPRQDFQDQQYAVTAELYLRTNFEIHKKSTLYIVAFPMGAWIGGLFTYQALKNLSKRGDYRLSIITPGISTADVLNALQNLGKDFDQVIIGSYAPFLKDILDEGDRLGLDWKQYNLGFVFSAEGFSEDFRDYVAKKTGIDNIFKKTLNHYGTVDMGTMSYETPLAILVRRLALKNQNIFRRLFPKASKLPTLTQYIPEQFYFEEVEGRLLCSSFSGLPLVRYDLKDSGGVIGLEEVKEIFLKEGIDLSNEVKLAGISDTIWNIPFVYVYERTDFSVSFFAFQVYPETIRKALMEDKAREYTTGKFTMLVRENEQMDQVLQINIELKKGFSESNETVKALTEEITNILTAENSEYRKTKEMYPEKTVPEIILWPYEHENFFKRGVKQKWIKNR